MKSYPFWVNIPSARAPVSLKLSEIYLSFFTHNNIYIRSEVTANPFVFTLVYLFQVFNLTGAPFEQMV